ncbi:MULTISPECIES: hypothetical protein [Cyanophyceae]|uniref:hypothetical protein n=1 Tax=Cyanophyceae TaxID=3028117 RepID=UPI001686B5EE|nr:hypothetical protein [Trichocoleus sp. FACHB-69]MBD1932887.1 hypothetical protein [Trichocoleus sp. FACHB-69]
MLGGWVEALKCAIALSSFAEDDESAIAFGKGNLVDIGSVQDLAQRQQNVNLLLRH